MANCHTGRGAGDDMGSWGPTSLRVRHCRKACAMSMAFSPKASKWNSCGKCATGQVCEGVSVEGKVRRACAMSMAFSPKASKWSSCKKKVLRVSSCRRACAMSMAFSPKASKWNSCGRCATSQVCEGVLIEGKVRKACAMSMAFSPKASK